jgi:hypothetical protein
MIIVVDLLEFMDYNAKCVVVDRLRKIWHLDPCHNDTDGKNLGLMFIQDVFQLHCLSDTIVLDSGPQVAGEFLDTYAYVLGPNEDYPQLLTLIPTDKQKGSML